MSHSALDVSGRSPHRRRSGAVHVAQYLRMSTDHQRYSIPAQKAAIASYAEARGYSLVATCENHGVSGLSLQKRNGLKHLLADLRGGAAGFDLILVYDISRGGASRTPIRGPTIRLGGSSATTRRELTGVSPSSLSRPVLS